MRPGIRNSFLGIIIVFAAGTRVTAQVAPPPPDAAKIPLSKIHACIARLNWKIFWKIIRAKRN